MRNRPLIESLLKARSAWKGGPAAPVEAVAGAIIAQALRRGARPWQDLVPPEEELGTRTRPTWWGRVVLLVEEAMGEALGGRFGGVEFSLQRVEVTLTTSTCEAPAYLHSAYLERVAGNKYRVVVRLKVERGGLDPGTESEEAFRKSFGGGASC